MVVHSDIASNPEEVVEVFVGDREPDRQSSNFKVCPAGVQFCSKCSIDEFQILEVKLNIPSDNSQKDEIHCSGVVVQCQAEPDFSFNIWVQFLDLSDMARNQLKCLSESSLNYVHTARTPNSGRRNRRI